MMFDHWKLHDKLIRLGWKKHQIVFFKKGMSDAIIGNWNPTMINVSPDRESYYAPKYVDPKMKPGPETYKEKAYVAGYEAAETFLKDWVKDWEPEE